MFHELQKLMWLQTPKGEATVLGFFDYGPEAELYWVCVQQDSCEIWVWPNDKVRALKNVSLGRGTGTGYQLGEKSEQILKGVTDLESKEFIDDMWRKLNSLTGGSVTFMGVPLGEDNQD